MNETSIKDTVPIYKKMTLTIREAAEYSNIGINKIDAMPAFDFDEERFRKNLAGCNETAPVFFISAATGEGIDPWIGWLIDEIDAWRQ